MSVNLDNTQRQIVQEAFGTAQTIKKIIEDKKSFDITPEMKTNIAALRYLKGAIDDKVVDAISAKFDRIETTFKKWENQSMLWLTGMLIALIAVPLFATAIGLPFAPVLGSWDLFVIAGDAVVMGITYLGLKYTADQKRKEMLADATSVMQDLQKL